jgi:hypothetical protein
MKKVLLLLMVAAFGIAGTATAQKHSKKNCGNDKNKYSKKYDRNGRYDDDRYNDRYDRNVSYNNNYNGNAPRKVRDAFYRDYPNAQNVRWSKDRGVWTASFKNGGLFGGSNSVSYAANGQRVGNNNIFGRRNDDRTAGNNDTRSPKQILKDKLERRQ